VGILFIIPFNTRFGLSPVEETKKGLSLITDKNPLNTEALVSFTQCSQVLLLLLITRYILVKERGGGQVYGA
jgi:hypothetical protein